MFEKLYWLIRFLVIGSGIYQIFFGEAIIGIATLVAVTLFIFPSFFTRHYIEKFPKEIELIFYIMVLFQLVIGEARDFYSTVPYYDKLVHFMLPMFTGLIGFMIFYTLTATGQLKITTASMLVLIILISLGIGAVWEIFEYLSDELLYPILPDWHHFQGSLTEDALHDTMNDLIADTLGGIFGAFLGLYVFRRASRKKSKRLSVFVEEMNKTTKKIF